MRNRNRINLITLIALLFVIAITLLVLQQTSVINKIIERNKQEKIKKEISYEVYHHVNGLTKILVIAEDTENGIEKLIRADNGLEIYCNGKKRVAYDYETDITGKESITFKALNTLGEEIEKTLLINDEFFDSLIDYTLIDETDTKQVLTINYKEGSTVKQYRVGDSSEWKNYGSAVKLDKNEIIETLGETNEEINVGIRQVDNGGNEIISKIKVSLEVIYNKGGKYNKPYIPKGFKHTEGTWNAGYTIIGETTSIGNEFVWVPCVLTEEQKQSAESNGDTVQIFQKTTTGKYNKDYLGFSLSLLPTDTSVQAEDNSVRELETSVGKYQGFYIAKYVAGIEGTTANYDLSEEQRKATDGTYKPLSQANKGVWNYISRENAITVSKEMINYEETGVYSTLISGAAWDTTLQWMVNSSDNKIANAEYDTNSTGKGWYSDVASDRIRTTGYYQVNNIYDMAGNVWGFTTENCRGSNGVACFVLRGRLLRQ